MRRAAAGCFNRGVEVPMSAEKRGRPRARSPASLRKYQWGATSLTAHSLEGKEAWGSTLIRSLTHFMRLTPAGRPPPLTHSLASSGQAARALRSLTRSLAPLQAAGGRPPPLTRFARFTAGGGRAPQPPHARTLRSLHGFARFMPMLTSAENCGHLKYRLKRSH